MKRMFLFLFISYLFVLIGCSPEPSEKVSRYQENNEIIGEEREDLIGEISDTIYHSVDRSNSDAEELMISPPDRKGESIIPSEGRYTISAGVFEDPPQSGRLLVYDENEVLLIDELLDFSYGVSSVTVDLNGSHTVHVDGLDQAFLTPVATEISNELTAGIWEVGKDIEAGSYAVIPADFSFGYLQIFEEGELPRVFEFLNSSPESAINVQLQLKDGQKLKISRLEMLQFEEQS